MKLFNILVVLFLVVQNAILSQANEDIDALKELIVQQNQQMKAGLLRLKALEEELTSQKDTIQRQNSVIEKLRQEMDELRAGNKYIEKQTAVRRNGSKHLDETGQSMTQTEEHINEENAADLHRRLLLPDTASNPDTTPVAFSASLSKDEVKLANHHTIIFDNVQTNYGNGYNKHNGAFIVPRAGVYVFTWTLVYHAIGEVCTHLIVNGIEKTNGYANGPSASWQTTTSLVVVHVEQGDTVLVQTIDYAGCNQVGSLYGDTWRKSSFSGWLIK